MRRALVSLTTLALTLPAHALAATEGEEEKFDPSHEFEQHAWIAIPKIELGGLTIDL